MLQLLKKIKKIKCRMIKKTTIKTGVANIITYAGSFLLQKGFLWDLPEVIKIIIIYLS